MKKIVSFRAASLGDTLMAKYLFENIRTKYPTARYVIVTSMRSEMLGELLEAYPWIEIKVANRKQPIRILSLLVDLWGADLVLVPASQGKFSLTSKIFGRIISARNGLWGFSDGSKSARILYDRLFTYSRDNPVIENELTFVRELGIFLDQKVPTFKVKSPNENLIKEMGLVSNQYIVINLFSGSLGRGLLPGNQQRLLDIVSSETQRYNIILTGGLHNKQELEKLNLPEHAQLFTGKISELLELLYFSRFVISIDTGVAHISSGIGKPLYVLSSYAGRAWWNRVQHPSSTHIVIGKKGLTEIEKVTKYPESLNNFSDEDLIGWLQRVA